MKRKGQRVTRELEEITTEVGHCPDCCSTSCPLCMTSLHHSEVTCAKVTNEFFLTEYMGHFQPPFNLLCRPVEYQRLGSESGVHHEYSP